LLFQAICVVLRWKSFILFSIKYPAHEKIGVVDTQWIVHQAVPRRGNQGKSDNGRAPWEGVRQYLPILHNLEIFILFSDSIA
jgi:hypothetical protein